MEAVDAALRVAVGELDGGRLADGVAEGMRVGEKEGEPTGCTHVSVTCPKPPLWPAPGI